MTTIDDVWPLFGLELRTPRLVLRPARDEDIPAVVDAATAGVHDPAVMPFSFPWTDQAPEVMGPAIARYHWSMRAAIQPQSWTVLFAIIHDGVVIGVQDLAGHQFPQLREVSTGSWLTQSVHGRGLGKEMRQAVLSFAFDHLGAREATSGAAEWNASSLGVSRALGYTGDGIQRAVTRPDTVETMVRLRVSKEDFVRPEWDLEVSGVAPVRAFLGLGDHA
jgi:RimJ/RimL family protein N-acetyltransferase